MVSSFAEATRAGICCRAVVILTALGVPVLSVLPVVAARDASPRATQAGKSTERVLEVPGGRPLVFQAGMPLDVALLFISRSGRVPIGFESARSATRVSIPPGAGPVKVTGLTVGPALDKLLEAVPPYEWRDVGGVIQVRPGARDASPLASPLDRRLPRLTIRDVPLGDAVDQVIAAIAPDGYPVGSGWGDDRPQQLHARVSVNLENPTVAEALTAIARAHGACGWALTYRVMPGAGDGLQPALTLFTFDGVNFVKSLPPVDQWKAREARR